MDSNVTSTGEHRINLARRNIKEWLDKINLPYHSPHKFRHGHIQYGMAHAKSIADYKAVSMNIMHSSMEITDEFYSNLNDSDIHNRISSLSQNSNALIDKQYEMSLLIEFIKWKSKQEKE